MSKLKASFIKLTQWEHWPTTMFYVPLIPYFIISAFKAKHPVYYLATNPGLKYSGNGTESKFITLELIPEAYKPKSIFIQENTSIDRIVKLVDTSGIRFPLIVKPDIGFRGYLVKMINTQNELEIYYRKNNINTIIQEFVDYSNECGIFYHRIPGTEKGRITSITLKKFLTVTGDGRSTLSELIQKNKRAFLYNNLLKNIHGEKLNEIPQQNEEILLSVIGNHSKGTQFINGNHLIDTELESAFDLITKDINGWFYGRLDIKYDSFEKLKNGEAFKILELNGIISEPTHIYDPSKTNYFSALKSIKEHWDIIKTISVKNHRDYRVNYPKIRPYVKDIFWLRSYAKKLKRLNKNN